MKNDQFTIIPDTFIKSVVSLTGLEDGPVYFLTLLVISILVVFVSFFVGNFVAKKNIFFNRVSRTEIVADLISQSISILIKLVGLIVALQIVGAGSLVGAVLGTAGVIGLGISFAFKDIIENYIAGVILSIKQPFFKGDLVNIEGIEGIIQRMTTRMTMVKSMDGNNISIPNAKVFKSNIINYSTNPFRRFEFKVGIMADGDPNQARKIGLSAMIKMDSVLDDPSPFAVTDSLGDSSILLIFYGWINQNEVDFLQIRSLAMSAVKDSIEKAGIDIPDPSYIVKIQDKDLKAPQKDKQESSINDELISPKNNQAKVATRQMELESSGAGILDKGVRE